MFDDAAETAGERDFHDSAYVGECIVIFSCCLIVSAKSKYQHLIFCKTCVQRMISTGTLTRPVGLSVFTTTILF
jgi:hypothetical protein